MHSLPRRALAEALGTFALVFVGVGSMASKYFPDANSGLLGVAVAHAVVLSVMMTATMKISGGHLNPAVTLSLLLVRRTNVLSAVVYVLAQLAGAILAAVLLKSVYPPGVSRATLLGTPTIGLSVTLGQAIIIEGVLTFLLVSAFFGTCVSPAVPNVGGFAVGLVLLGDILVGGPLTGAAVNPARAFGPALVSGNWVAHITYWVGPIVGGAVAAVFWEHLLLPRKVPSTTLPHNDF